MSIKIGCPKCGALEYWKIRRGKRKCKRCRGEYRYKLGGLNLKEGEWDNLLRWFALEQSIKVIHEQTGISRYKIMRALDVTRRSMILEASEVFEGEVEVDETYIGGQWKNKRRAARKARGKRGRGTSKQPVFGILCRGGKVWAEVVPDVEAATLMPLLGKRVKRGSTVYSDTWKSYTGVASKGYVHRLIDHGKGEYTDFRGNHINGLEGFWGYLKRKLAAKGGIRKQRLPFYLAEYVWRYNNRHLGVKQKVKALKSLLISISSEFGG